MTRPGAVDDRDDPRDEAVGAGELPLLVSEELGEALPDDAEAREDQSQRGAGARSAI